MQHTLDNLKKDLKRDFLARIIVSLRNGKWSKNEAKVFSRRLLNILKLSDERKFIQEVTSLARSKPEATNALLAKLTNYEEGKSEERLKDARRKIAKHFRKESVEERDNREENIVVTKKKTTLKDTEVILGILKQKMMLVAAEKDKKMKANLEKIIPVNKTTPKEVNIWKT